MFIVQDREGDIYEQFATIPDEKKDLLIRAKTNRKLKDGTKLFSCFSAQASQGSYEIVVDACKKKRRPKRTATIEIKYKPITIKKTNAASNGAAKEVNLYLIEAIEINFYVLHFYLNIEHCLLNIFLVKTLNFQCSTINFQCSSLERFNNLMALPSPSFPIQTPVLYCFCKVLGFYICTVCKVCNGATYF